MVDFDHAKREIQTIELRIKTGQDVLRELMYKINPGFMTDLENSRIDASPEEIGRINQTINFEIERMQSLEVLPSDKDLFDMTEKFIALDFVQLGNEIDNLAKGCIRRYTALGIK